MVEIGNFQLKYPSQIKPEIKYDTFTDTTTLNNYYSSRPNSIKILEFFDWSSFNWSQSYIKSRFTMAESYKNKVDGLVFLLQEEVYKPSKTPQSNISTANGPSYTLENTIIPQMPGNEDSYFVALLTAWKKLCVRLKKKCILLGSPAVCSDDSVWEYIYGNPAINYISSNFDMIYLYHFPITIQNATGSNCTQQNGKTGKYDAKSYIQFWRKKGFNKLINYLLVTKFAKGVGTADNAVVEADFVSALNAGADIISCYPFKNELNNDHDATTRLISLYNKYNTSCKAISLNFSIN